MRWLVAALGGLLPAMAIAVEIGDGRAEVVAELGQPQSTMAVGNQEFLTFPNGRVVLTDGSVSALRGEFSPAAPAMAEDAADAAKKADRPRRPRWYTDIDAAMAAAEDGDKRILALFTGSDWCPPCQRFEAEVAHDEQFAGIFAPDFIFFKCDWLRNTPQTPQVADEVNRLRRKYGISRYPTLKILDAFGEELDEVDWTSVRGGTFKEAMIEAIDNSRRATEGGKKASSRWWPF